MLRGRAPPAVLEGDKVEKVCAVVTGSEVCFARKEELFELVSTVFCRLSTGEPVGEAVDLTIIFDTLEMVVISLLVDVNDFTTVAFGFRFIGFEISPFCLASDFLISVAVARGRMGDF